MNTQGNIERIAAREKAAMPLTENSDVRWFPVITDRTARPRNNKVPWKLAEIAYVEYARRYGTDQSLERIAERGGFGLLEIADYLLAQLKDREEKLAAVNEWYEKWQSVEPQWYELDRILQGGK